MTKNNTNFDLVLLGGNVVVPNEQNELKIETLNIGLKDGKIEVLSPSPLSGKNILNLKGLHVLPGLIDSQVHFREPGLEHKEDLATGSLSAICGGITSVFEMPNTKPSTTSAEDITNKVHRAQNRMWTHHAFYLGATDQNKMTIESLEQTPGCCGVKVFMGSSTGSLLVSDDQTLLDILSSGHRRVAVHCEDEERLKERFHLAQSHPGDVSQHPIWRDELTALRATQRLLHLAEKTNRPVHVLHVTTAEEIEFLSQRKHLASVECTPQHLTLTAPECYERLGSKAQMNPPIRSQKHLDALWKGLDSGVIDIIGSDHAPHTLEEKSKVYPNSPSGMPGVQTTVPLMLNHISQNRLSLTKLVELMAVNPCQLFHIKNKGAIRVGYDADFTIVDLKKEKIIENRWIRSKCGWTPFDGMKVIGWPQITIVKGHISMQEDQVMGTPQGLPLQF